MSTDISSWNPFGDCDDFGGLSEDMIIGREFDKIRRGSNSSKCFVLLKIAKTITFDEFVDVCYIIFLDSGRPCCYVLGLISAIFLVATTLSIPLIRLE